MPYEVMYGMMHNEKTLSSGGGIFLWRESVPDPRWGYRSYLDLKVYDSNKDETVWLSDNRRFIASAITHDGEKAVAIEYTHGLHYKLSLFNLTDKKELSSSQLENTGHIFDPAISDDGTLVALSSLSDNGNAILIFNTVTGKIKKLTDNTFNESFRSLEFFGNYFYMCLTIQELTIYMQSVLKQGKNFRLPQENSAHTTLLRIQLHQFII
jgi:hypothetical protein